MFRLIIIVKRGSASNLAAAWARYRTIEDAREGAAATLREERVQHVVIVEDTWPEAFVEWFER
jgi:hypothetical protein